MSALFMGALFLLACLAGIATVALWVAALSVGTPSADDKRPPTG